MKLKEEKSEKLLPCCWGRKVSPLCEVSAAFGRANVSERIY